MWTTISRVVLLSLTIASYQPAPAQVSQLKVLNAPVINVGRATGSGDGTLWLRNDSANPVDLKLSASISSPKPSAVRVRFSPEGTSASEQDYFDLTIPAKGLVKVAIHVSDDWVDGDVAVDIFDQKTSTKLGSIQATRFPFAVKFDDSNADHTKLEFDDQIPTRIILRNDDPAEYAVGWKLIRPEGDIGNCHGTATLPPKGAAVLTCIPDFNFRNDSSIGNIIRADASRDGYALLLWSVDPNQGGSEANPLKIMKVEGSLNFFGAATRQKVSYALVILLLIAGGVSSLFISYSIPNRLKRLDVKEQLGTIARKTADLSTRIDSRLAVLVRLERSRILDSLQTRNSFSPDFSNLATQIKAAIDRLAARLAALQRLDIVLEQLEKRLPTGVPPSQVDVIYRSLDGASVPLSKAEPDDDDLKAANDAVDQASTLIDQLSHLSDDFGKELYARARDLRAEIDSGLASSEAFGRIGTAVPGPLSVLRQLPSSLDGFKQDKYAVFDNAVEKMLLMRDYALLLRASAGSPSTSNMSSHLQAMEPGFFEMLRREGWESLQSARLMLREMKENISPPQLIDGLGDAFIAVNPEYAYESSPLELSVSFRNPLLNSATARMAITSQWEFGDGLSGSGWSVSHYFMLRKEDVGGISRVTKLFRRGWRRMFKGKPIARDGAFTVKVKFYDSEGKPVVDAGGKPRVLETCVVVHRSVLAQKVGERTWIETIKLAVALLVAIFALIAGAREQLAKLDLLPALTAVFAIGFGADTIKNLLGPKSPS